MCSVLEYRPTEIHISLLCAIKGSSLGKKLLEAVDEYGKKNNFTSITLLALPEKSLVEWYKRRGFKEGKVEHKTKCVEMYKIL